MGDLDQANFEYLPNRSIIPLIRPRLAQRPAFQALKSVNLAGRFTAESRFDPDTDDVPDLDNVQGDIIYLFPKVSGPPSSIFLSNINESF